MGCTLIEKIIAHHSDTSRPRPGELLKLRIDARVARDFGGANVVKNLESHALSIHDPEKTYFTFDCNPGGTDQKYTSNQQICRVFARMNGIRVFDIENGIGTHLAIEKGIAVPGATFVSTDSHANILGAIGAFGQGMGDTDITAAFATGEVWFKTPPSVRIVLEGHIPPSSSAKDAALALLKHFGASGLLGMAAEFSGSALGALGLAERITIASMATEMGAIIALFPPNEEILRFSGRVAKTPFQPVFADADAEYASTCTFDLSTLEPLISRPGRPEDVVPVRELRGVKIDSAFIGSCTNGRLEDMKAAARVLKGKKAAPGVVLKIVPATHEVWRQCLKEGLMDLFAGAGALIGNPGCGGCAEGQIGQNGPGEATVSTGNRNFSGKQGRGDVYLASPATAAASAAAGHITSRDMIPEKPSLFTVPGPAGPARKAPRHQEKQERPEEIRGRIWVIPVHDIDTDMIFHNRYLAMTDIRRMGEVAFDNLKGWEHFSRRAKPGDIIITGSNFGAGSSRQQAVDCFHSLRIGAIIAKSFGAIYERNAINTALPVLTGDLLGAGLEDGEELTVHFRTGRILRHKTGEPLAVTPFSPIQMEIYKRGGLLE